MVIGCINILGRLRSLSQPIHYRPFVSKSYQENSMTRQLLFLFACGLCFSWQCALVVAACDDNLSSTPDKPVFKNGEAQVVEAFKENWIQHDLFVETEFDSDADGKLDRMHVSVTRPKQTDNGLKVPVIYQSSPYYSGVGVNDSKYMWDPRQELSAEPPKHDEHPAITQQERRTVLSNEHLKDWVPRGFAVVHSSSPGTGLSQGCATIGADNESLAPKAIIDWLCGRAKGFKDVDSQEQVHATWCTGRVGMTGTSYNGTLCLSAATTGVEGLKVIIPVAPNTSYYHYYRSNGLVRHPGGYMGEDIDVLYDFVNSGPTAMRDKCNCEVRDKELLASLDRKTGNYNEFWRGRDYIHDLGPMKAAMLMSHAFNDWNVMPEHSIRIFQAVKAKGLPTQLFMHQGGHGGPPPLSQMNRWFSHYLYDVDNGVAKDAQSWIVREGETQDKPTAYSAYPHPQSSPVTLATQGNGLSTGQLVARDKAVASLRKPQTLVDNFSFSAPTLTKAEWSNHRLLFATETLKSPVHISGTAKIKIRLACDKPVANLSIWLVALPWTDSRSINDDVITRGWADPQNADSIYEDRPMQPGQFREISFELQPDDQIIPAGQQLGLLIFSSDRDFTLWPEPGTQLTIDLAQTELTLPIVGGPQAFEASFQN
jgi:X-Pro dipeptidyl-peptidase